MSRIRTPDNIEIASLKKKQQAVFDPMTSGVGTPWEDRGTHGVIGAFIKTCTASMFAQAKLTSKIRRPETTNDATGYLIGISTLWALSALLHEIISIYREYKASPEPEIVEPNAAILCALALAGGGLGMFFLFKVYNAIYGRLTSQEKDSVRLPDVLLYNVSVYALGPSVLALIPFAGPPIAMLWIFINLVIGGSSRLRLRTPAAVIDALIALLAVLAVVGAVYLVVDVLILHKLMDYGAVYKPDITLPLSPAAPSAPKY